MAGLFYFFDDDPLLCVSKCKTYELTFNIMGRHLVVKPTLIHYIYTYLLIIILRLRVKIKFVTVQ